MPFAPRQGGRKKEFFRIFSMGTYRSRDKETDCLQLEKDTIYRSVSNLAKQWPPSAPTKEKKKVRKIVDFLTTSQTKYGRRLSQAGKTADRSDPIGGTAATAPLPACFSCPH